VKNQQPSQHSRTRTTYRAADLHSITNSKSNTRVTEQRTVGTRVDTKIKVQVSTILVGTSKAILRAKRVSTRRTQIGDLDDDTVACVGQLVAAAVCFRGQFPAGAACWSGALAWSDAEFVLGYGRAVAWRGVEAAGGAGGVAVAGAEGVAAAVLGERGLVGGGCGGEAEGAGGGQEEGCGVHLGCGL